MRFQSQAEMDQNAKQWIALILIAMGAVSAILMVVVVASNTDLMAALLKLFAPR